jgi:hypothetical protein
MEATGASAPLLEGDAENFDGVEGPPSGEKLPLQENPSPELTPASDEGMIQVDSYDSVSSDGEPQQGGRSRRTLDKLSAKRDAEYERQHAEFIKKLNLEQARLLHEEIDRLNERRVKMADELFDREKYMAERRADLERSVAKREMRLERLDEKLQEARQKLVETIAEVKLRARTVPREPSEAVAIDSDDDFVASTAETADNVLPTSTPSLKATAPPLNSDTAEPPSTVKVLADFLVRTVSTNIVRSISDASIAPKAFTGKTEQDAEEWYGYCERYAEFRKLLPHQKRELFSLLMRDRAADWLLTLPKEESATYARLVEAFKRTTFAHPS